MITLQAITNNLIVFTFFFYCTWILIAFLRTIIKYESLNGDFCYLPPYPHEDSLSDISQDFTPQPVIDDPWEGTERYPLSVQKKILALPPAQGKRRGRQKTKFSPKDFTYPEWFVA